MDSGESLLASWSPEAGDPTVLGWLTTAGYLLCALSCWRARRAALRERRAGGTASPGFWTVLAAALVLLGANKELDLQSALRDWGRSLAEQQGWYEQRRSVQVAFVALVGVLLAATCAALFFLARRERRRVLLALCGWLALCAFVGIRAVAFHVAPLSASALWGVTRLEPAALVAILAGSLVYAHPRGAHPA